MSREHVACAGGEGQGEADHDCQLSTQQVDHSIVSIVRGRVRGGRGVCVHVCV